MSVEIRQYKEGDIEGIKKLFSISFNGDITKEWLLWKYGQSPWGAVGYVAKCDDVVCAFYGGLRMGFIYKQKGLYAYQLCDVMTHPDYRGKIFSKTPLVAMLGEMLYKENEMDFAFGFPSVRHARLQALRLGGKAHRMIMQFKKVVLSPRHRFFDFISISMGWELLDSKKMADIVNSLDIGLVSLKKDRLYFKWRYQRHPLKRYEFACFRQLGKIVGFVIFKIDDKEAKIMDLFIGNIKWLKNILGRFEQFIFRRYDAVDCIKIWCHTNDPKRVIYEDMGYVGEEHIPIAFKPINMECGVTEDIFYEGFYYSMGDYDAE